MAAPARGTTKGGLDARLSYTAARHAPVRRSMGLDEHCLARCEGLHLEMNMATATTAARCSSAAGMVTARTGCPSALYPRMFWGDPMFGQYLLSQQRQRQGAVVTPTGPKAR